jgi:TonB family protein
MKGSLRITSWPAGLACLFLLSCALAQQPAPSPVVYRAGGDVKPPALQSSDQPEYTDSARVARLTGTVLVSLIVGDDGRARDLKVTKSLGLGLDESALATVARWRFQPGAKNGQPVAVMTTVEVSYHLLLDQRDWHTAKAGFELAPNATPPTLYHSADRLAKGKIDKVSATASFDITPDGQPKNIQIQKSSNPKYNSELTAFIRDWRFRPAMQGGQPIVAKATFEMSRGD